MLCDREHRLIECSTLISRKKLSTIAFLMNSFFLVNSHLIQVAVALAILAAALYRHTVFTDNSALQHSDPKQHSSLTRRLDYQTVKHVRGEKTGEIPSG